MHSLLRSSWLAILVMPLLALSAQAAKLSPTKLELAVGETATVKVSKIKGTPTLGNSSPAAIAATLASDRITVQALAVGSAVLTLTDQSGSRTVSVAVKPSMTVTPAVANLTVGETATLTVNDATGRARLKNGNDGVAKAKLSGNAITVTGKAPGTAFLIVSDKKIEVVVQVNVASVAPPPTSGGGSVNGRLLASNCFQCHGTNGSGGFDRLRGSRELLQELREFASGGEDAGGIMAAHAAGYTDAQMKAIADYLANQ